MKLFTIDRDEGTKCGSCLWESSRQYVLADTLDEAEKLVASGDAGLCGDCMAELLVDQGYIITQGNTGVGNVSV